MSLLKILPWMIYLTAFSGSVSAAEGFVGNIDELTLQNKNFRQVIYTGKKMQLVLMSLKPGEEIGEEVHQNVDQFFRVENGRGEVFLNGKKTAIEEDDAVLIPAGTKHNVVNTGKGPLQIYTLYGPPEHKDGTIHTTKPNAAEE